ncbi:hypothetical protein LOC68_07685 [Blastopirellula sp. JC732]|uniref:Uncharacterized protein n=1 Tax=Blastopirellula sediminis TaxID=2894196 RepID=A0A9X1SFW8_9BACT|nr:hypothetical protein [Blastopirellula sediminis]MCC9608951.1 hypothetical protein [Blastopirellula sediminis]MCC9628272.1 hypothetical protein [Blastopirellula sediminis]
MSDLLNPETSLIGRSIQRLVDKYVARRLRRFQIWESDWGRTAGWILEYDGAPIALLSDPIWEDMFWYSYEMEFRQNDYVTEAEFYSDDFWNVRVFEGYRWRNCYFDGYDGSPFSGKPPTVPGMRIFMRALYLSNLPRRTPFDKWILWWRKRNGQTWTPPVPAFPRE